MKTKSSLLHTLIAACLLLAACSTASNEPTPVPTLDPNAMGTSVALTVEAELTEVAASMPTSTSLPPTETEAPIATESPSQAAPTATPAPPTATALPPVDAQFDYHAELVADVTIPDGTEMGPGNKFTKTWRLRNIGKLTWPTSFTFVFINGTRMEGQAIKLPNEVLPGQTIDLSIPMTAPNEAGSYTGYWSLRNDEGEIFGLGPNANLSVFVLIKVVGGTATATATPTGPTATPGTPTATPTQGNALISNVALSITDGTFTGACPHTFNLTANITLNGPGTFQYQLEATAENPGYTFNLPAATNETSGQQGTHTLSLGFTLDLTNSVNGQVLFHILSPNDVKSAPVPFSLTCQ